MNLVEYYSMCNGVYALLYLTICFTSVIIRGQVIDTL